MGPVGFLEEKHLKKQHRHSDTLYSSKTSTTTTATATTHEVTLESMNIESMFNTNQHFVALDVPSLYVTPLYDRSQVAARFLYTAATTTSSVTFTYGIDCPLVFDSIILADYTPRVPPFNPVECVTDVIPREYPAPVSIYREMTKSRIRERMYTTVRIYNTMAVSGIDYNNNNKNNNNNNNNNNNSKKTLVIDTSASEDMIWSDDQKKLSRTSTTVTTPTPNTTTNNNKNVSSISVLNNPSLNLMEYVNKLQTKHLDYLYELKALTPDAALVNVYGHRQYIKTDILPVSAVSHPVKYGITTTGILPSAATSNKRNIWKNAVPLMDDINR